MQTRSPYGYALCAHTKCRPNIAHVLLIAGAILRLRTLQLSSTVAVQGGSGVQNNVNRSRKRGRDGPVIITPKEGL